jgi:hypothetical protein
VNSRTRSTYSLGRDSFDVSASFAGQIRDDRGTAPASAPLRRL